MVDKATVIAAAESHLKGTPHFLVEVHVSHDNRVVVAIDSDAPLGIDDCITLSRAIEEQFDREVEDFELEVGSCGITAPFKVFRQYLKNIGKEVEVLIKGGKKKVGILHSATPDRIELAIEKSVKLEGAKRKTTVTEIEPLPVNEIKTIKNVIRFK